MNSFENYKKEYLKKQPKNLKSISFNSNNE